MLKTCGSKSKTGPLVHAFRLWCFKRPVSFTRVAEHYLIDWLIDWCLTPYRQRQSLRIRLWRLWNCNHLLQRLRSAADRIRAPKISAFMSTSLSSSCTGTISEPQFFFYSLINRSLSHSLSPFFLSLFVEKLVIRFLIFRRQQTTKIAQRSDDHL